MAGVSAHRPAKKKPSDRRYTQQLLRQLPPGFQVAYAEVPGTGANEAARMVGSHPCVFTPEGELLRLPDGRPVQVCGTPGDRRALQNDLASVRRALRALA